ncbi:tyrosine recombinase XerC [Umezawaea endophytica]|uniref:Integrase n=1 Tax=Umezawaea endophytica TaxID=1654476 RepID=A0A9X3A645_9PSEU|nr:integrase [Umezawaea endophytica]MCS7484394.1 integrase [Umezawaea endophytica]
MNPTFKVSIWEIKTLKPGTDGKKRPKPYGVRWLTAGKEHSEWYRTKALANNRRSNLIQATQNGEAFDIKSGLPESEFKLQSARSLLQLAQEFIGDEWQESAPNTRKRYVDTLAIPVAAFVNTTKDVPDERALRRVLTTCLLPLNQRDRVLTPEESTIVEWIKSASRPVRELASKVETANLLRAVAKNLGGKSAAAWTTRTRRGVLHHLLSYAVDAEELVANPVTGLRASVQRGNSEVDPRAVLNTRQAPQLLSAVTYAGTKRGQYDYLYAFFAVMYYGALRPCEVNRIREVDCELPETGWGELLLSKSASRSNARYIDSGELWEERNLKRRAEGAVRPVPIPPVLVRILRWHLKTFGTTADGRLFRGTISGGPVSATVYTDAWRKARKIGLSPLQEASPLAGDPYDLRHAAVSTWLAAGVSPAEVAERAGHTVDVLLKVYARVLDGQRETSNKRIDELLDDES